MTAFHIVNAFAPTAHVGSQAAVILLKAADGRFDNEAWLTAWAGDFDMPATVFVRGTEIKWYTRTGLPLCGHGTVAAAKVVFDLDPEINTVTFTNHKAGEITAARVPEGVRISMPIARTTAAPELVPVVMPALLEAGLLEQEIKGVAAYDWAGRSVVVLLDGGVDLRAVKVDPKALGKHNTVTILTQLFSADGPLVRVHSRVFIPAIGLDEDIITGSAHSVLTGFYLSPDGPGHAALKELTTEATELDAYQLSPRGGSMRCSLENGRARIVGSAWRVAEGKLLGSE